MLTFDTNRLGNVLQRRFNASWRELDDEPVYLLPQCAKELMGGRIDPYALDIGASAVEEELAIRRNTLAEKQRLWGESVLWWSQQFKEKTLYRIRHLSPTEQAKANTICAHFDRLAFPKADSSSPLDAHGDAILMAEAFATNTKVLLTNDEKIRHGVLHQWATENAERLDIENTHVLFIQDVFLEENYATRGDLDFLYQIVLGASWPGDDQASNEDVVQSFNRYINAMVGKQTGLSGIGRTIEQSWQTDMRKDAVIDAIRDRLPSKMRQSEKTHPTYSKRDMNALTR